MKVTLHRLSKASLSRDNNVRARQRCDNMGYVVVRVTHHNILMKNYEQGNECVRNL